MEVLVVSIFTENVNWAVYFYCEISIFC